MGVSLTLLKKEFIEFSIEVDRNISLEMGTGFGGSNRVTTHVNIPVTLEELQEVIMQLQQNYDMLKTAWKCKFCLALNPISSEVCNTCDLGKNGEP